MDSGRAAKIKLLVEKGLDWGYMIPLARRHGMMALLYCHLKSVCREAVPTATLAELRDQFHANTCRNLLLFGELLQVLELFRAHAIRAIPYKGPALASCLYGGLSLRQFCDLDIVVPREQAVKAKELLARRGYRLNIEISAFQQTKYLRNECEFCMVRKDGKVAVEIHWEIVPRYMVASIDLQQLWQRLVSISFAGATVLSFPPEDLLLILSVHGTKHRWERLDWICGISELIRRHHEINWKQVTERAEMLGGRRMLLLGLFLASDLLGTELPGEILEKIEADPAIRSLATKVRARLFDPPDNKPDVFAMSFFHLRARERLRDKIRYIFRLATTPNPGDWALLDLPAFLYFLYYVIRPIRLVTRYGAVLFTTLFTSIHRRDAKNPRRHQSSVISHQIRNLAKKTRFCGLAAQRLRKEQG